MNEDHPVIRKILAAVAADRMGIALAWDKTRPRSNGHDVSVGTAISRGAKGSKRRKNRLGVMIHLSLPKEGHTWAGVLTTFLRKEITYVVNKPLLRVTPEDLRYMGKVEWAPESPATIIDQIADLA
jgi:hypothetical protein